MVAGCLRLWALWSLAACCPVVARRRIAQAALQFVVELSAGRKAWSNKLCPTFVYYLVSKIIFNRLIMKRNAILLSAIVQQT